MSYSSTLEAWYLSPPESDGPTSEEVCEAWGEVEKLSAEVEKLVEALHEAHPSKQYMSWEFQDEYSFEQMYEEGDLVAEGVGTGCLKHVFEQTDPIWVGLYWDFEADSGAMEAFAEADWDEFLDVLDDLRVAVQKLSCAEAEYVELRDSCDEDYDDY